MRAGRATLAVWPPPLTDQLRRCPSRLLRRGVHEESELILNATSPEDFSSGLVVESVVEVALLALAIEFETEGVTG